jgi:hypothetical protein
LAFGQRRTHAAVERQVERHRRVALQPDARAVVAVGQIDTVDIQCVLALCVDVVAGEVHGLDHRRPGPAHGADAEGQVHIHRQHDPFERLQRLAGDGRGAAAFYQHVLRDDLAQLHLALEQRLERPADRGLVHLDRQRGALPLQVADAAAGAQRAAHVAALQRLAGRHVARGLGERVGERLVGAQPPPRAGADGDHQNDERRERPRQATQHAACARPALRRWRSGRLVRLHALAPKS